MPYTCHKTVIKVLITVSHKMAWGDHTYNNETLSVNHSVPYSETHSISRAHIPLLSTEICRKWANETLKKQCTAPQYGSALINNVSGPHSRCVSGVRSRVMYSWLLDGVPPSALVASAALPITATVIAITVCCCRLPLGWSDKQVSDFTQSISKNILHQRLDPNESIWQITFLYFSWLCLLSCGTYLLVMTKGCNRSRCHLYPNKNKMGLGQTDIFHRALSFAALL